jgi:hypothetical protein
LSSAAEANRSDAWEGTAPKVAGAPDVTGAPEVTRAPEVTGAPADTGALGTVEQSGAREIPERPTPAARTRRVDLQDVFVCVATGEDIVGVHLRARGRETDGVVLRLSGAPEDARLLQPVRHGCVVVGLLPKSLYLLRTLEVPRVLPHEVPAMLRLEVAASLPPEIGPVEISYRSIPARKEGYERYQAYIARREDLNQYSEAIGKAGVHPDVLLPSAVCWVELAEFAPGTDLLVAGFGGGSLEVASVAGEEPSVRSLRRTDGADPSSESSRILIECIRSLLPQRGDGDSPVAVSWIAGECPQHLANGWISFRQIAGLGSPPAGVAATGEVERLLQLTARAVARCRPDTLAAANLLPADVLRRQRRSAVRRTALLAAVCFAAAIAVAFAALRVAVHRGRARTAEVSSQIARIKTDGDAVGRRLEKLEAIRRTRLTRNDFAGVLAALLEATPPEMSYSSVDLTEAGHMRLQGQATSLSLPFLLPERLEKSGLFVDVMLQDAGQTKKADGSVAEFRIDCRLKREGAK